MSFVVDPEHLRAAARRFLGHAGDVEAAASPSPPDTGASSGATARGFAELGRSAAGTVAALTSLAAELRGFADDALETDLRAGRAFADVEREVRS